MRKLGLCLFTLLVAGWASASAGAPRELTFEDRVKAQRAIEEVFWRHRTWPKDNPESKPSLSAVMPDAAIRSKVDDYLRKSNALVTWWRRPVRAEQLQAEIDRMVKNTRDPKMLRELFEALGNDPFLIAETLARPTLVGRLVVDGYAGDERFHREARQAAEHARSNWHRGADLRAIGGAYREQTWRRDEIGDERWTSLVRRLSLAFDVAVPASGLDAAWADAQLGRLPLGEASRMKEDGDGFSFFVIESSGVGYCRLSVVGWMKTSFEPWWKGRLGTEVPSLTSPQRDYVVPSFPQQCTDDTWVPTSQDVPDPRSGHTAVWTGSEMIIWGGGYWAPLATGGKYDPSTDTWSPTKYSETTPVARTGHTAVWTGTEMIVWGGLGLNSGGRYNPLTDSWTPTSVGNGVPSPRTGHSAVWTGSRMVVWGGADLASGSQYDPDTDSWTPLSTANAPSPRSAHSAVWTGSLMLVWGGQYSGGGTFQLLTSGGKYDPISDTWTPMSVSGAPPGNYQQTAVWSGTQLIFCSGYVYADPPTRTGGRYDPSTDSWEPMGVDANAPPVTNGETAVWTGHEMIVWGEGVGGRYDPDTDSWTAVSTIGAPPQHNSGHSAVWTGSEMVIWGGGRSTWAILNAGGRYDPTTDSWIPTSRSATVPSARSRHTAVWTGAEMVMWGGVAYDNQPSAVSNPNSGGRYRPVLDTWATTSLDGAPPGRTGNTAVWTGSEIVVWGGGWPETQDGGRYDPTTDMWNATSTSANVPSARTRHTAVWTGSEMVVWGGYTRASGALDTGARFDPKSNTWRPVSSSAARPSARACHATAWTGNEMIVWGGSANGDALSDGARYDPSNDSWTPMSDGPWPACGPSSFWTGATMLETGGASYCHLSPGLDECTGSSLLGGGAQYDPSIDQWAEIDDGPFAMQLRSEDAAVWTGSELIIWGGGDRSVWLRRDGGRYSPSTDSWRPTSVEPNTPARRMAPSGVWTGTYMIVWGGRDDVTDVFQYSGGALYCAVPDCTVNTWYYDRDGDGHGDSRNSVLSCPQPAGYVVDDDDCDDTRASVHPGAAEICDALDDDCNGLVDEDASGVDSDSDSVRNACDDCRFAFNPDQLDTDGDGVGNACDNCLALANADQQDADSDARGDACDNCPMSYNPWQDDVDDDLVGDVCDDCLYDYNPAQSDSNHDQVGDVCDLHDGIILIFSTDKAYVEWQPEAGPTAWNVYEGDLAVLRSSGEYSQAPGSNPLADRHCGVVDPWVEDFGAPPEGAVKFALVTGVQDGAEWSLGADGAGNPRPNAHPCP